MGDRGRRRRPAHLPRRRRPADRDLPLGRTGRPRGRGVMGAPNPCEPCGFYHARDYRDCVRRQKPAPFVPRENIEIPEPEASDPKFVAGWRHGYEAAERDQAERGDA